MKALMFRKQITQLRRLHRSNSKALLFVLAFAAIGSILLFTTRAAGPFASLEPEQGASAGATCQVSDATASNNTAVQFGGCPTAGTASSVSQYGITWSFDKAYPTGQFANGDYWVKGPVTITRITPDYNGTNHGWEVNPLYRERTQGLDKRAGSFDAGLVPSLPYAAVSGSSILKVISRNLSNASCVTTDRPCLQTAAVLTVVGDIPPDNGATVFRPPYIGTDKPYISTTTIKTDLLPKLPQVSLATSGTGSKTLSSVENRFKKVQLDHVEGPGGRVLHPIEHMPDYGGAIGRDNGDGALRLMLDEPIAQKMPALISYLQMGIDHYSMAKLGMRWQNQGGHSPGRRISLAFTAVMLDNAAMKQFSRDLLSLGVGLAGYQGLQEDFTLQQGRDGRGLYGQTDGTEDSYWESIRNGGSSGSRSKKDPYGLIDGGYRPGGSYQLCCTSVAWKGEALAAQLMPQIKDVWKGQTLFEYSDRWVTHGTWTQPDPCAPIDQDGGPDGSGGCKLDPDLTPGSTMANFSCQTGKACGRFPELHGTSKDAKDATGKSLSGYYSRFSEQMWDAYR